LRKQWYITAVRRISSREACISSAAGCISFRNDDIQNFVLMICNSCGIDDIHGYAVILRLSSKPYYKTHKYLFRSLYTKNPSLATWIFSFAWNTQHHFEQRENIIIHFRHK